MTAIRKTEGPPPNRGWPEIGKLGCKMPKGLSSLHVLVIDDEPLICWSLAETLEEHGEKVTEACSAETALRALATAPAPDVVLLDYHLPDSRDLNLLAAVKRLAPNSQVILMSAYTTPEIAKQAVAHGAYRVVSKPMDMHDVPALVREASESRPD